MIGDPITMPYSLPTRIGYWVDAKTAQDMDREMFEHKKKTCKLIKHKQAKLFKDFLSPVKKLAKRNYLFLNFPYQIVHGDDYPNKPMCLSVTPDENVMHKAEESYYNCIVTASESLEPCLRNSFKLLDPNPNGNQNAKVTYEENVYIAMESSEGHLYLRFHKVQVKSIGETTPITLVKRPDPHCLFQLRQSDPFYRDFNCLIHNKDRVLIQHTLTGRNIIFKRNIVPTLFGAEICVTCDHELTDKKRETNESIWTFQ